MNKILTFPITPQTNVRTTQNDRIWFKIPEECPHNCGLPRRKKIKDPDGCRHCLAQEGLVRKRRIERYNKYKEDLSAMAKEKHYRLDDIGTGLRFYMPMPKRWSKAKRKMYHLKWHQRTPDLNNLLKAFEDSLRVDDEKIAGYTHLEKIWVDNQTGWIQITLPAAVKPLRLELSSPNITRKLFG